jgi:hypothetical protein
VKAFVNREQRGNELFVGKATQLEAYYVEVLGSEL